MIKNLPTKAGDARDVGLILGLGRESGIGNGNPLHNILEWKIPWTEEPGGLQSRGSKESDITEQLSTHTHIICSPKNLENAWIHEEA